MPSEPSSAARDEERRRGTGGEVGGERHRVGVAQQPIGEQDVDGVGSAGAERHPDPDQIGVHGSAADERDAPEDPDERERAGGASAARARSSRRRRRRARGARSGRARRAAPTSARASRRRAPSRARRRRRRARRRRAAARSGTRQHLAAGDPDEQERRSEIAPGEHAGDGGAVRVRDLDQDRRDRERDAGSEAEERAAEVGEREDGPCIKCTGG